MDALQDGGMALGTETYQAFLNSRMNGGIYGLPTKVERISTTATSLQCPIESIVDLVLRGFI